MNREDAVSRCESVDDVLALLEERDGWSETWQSFFSGLLDASGLGYSRFASRSGLSKNTVRRWCRQGGAPKSRDSYIKVGFGAAMPPQAVSDMLSEYGGYCGLNPATPLTPAASSACSGRTGASSRMIMRRRRRCISA